MTIQTDLFDDIVVFALVADKRSFTVAAGELGLTTAAVSISIKRLEARMGVELFARTTRSVRVTEAGTIFLGYVPEAISQIEAGVEAARKASMDLRNLLPENQPASKANEILK